MPVKKRIGFIIAFINFGGSYENGESAFPGFGPYGYFLLFPCRCHGGCDLRPSGAGSPEQGAGSIPKPVIPGYLQTDRDRRKEW